MGSTAESTHASDRAGLVCAGLCAMNGAFVPGSAKLTTTDLSGVKAAVFATAFAALAAIAVRIVRPSGVLEV